MGASPSLPEKYTPNPNSVKRPGPQKYTPKGRLGKQKGREIDRVSRREVAGAAMFLDPKKREYSASIRLLDGALGGESLRAFSVQKPEMVPAGLLRFLLA